MRSALCGPSQAPAPCQFFAVIADTHIGYRVADETGESRLPLESTRAFHNFSWAMDQVNHVEPDLLLVPGDLVTSGNWGHEDEYGPFMKIIRRSRAPVLYAMGNHEGESTDPAAHRIACDDFTEHTGSPTVYHKKVNDWHWIIVNSSMNGNGGKGGWGVVGADQIEWLKKELTDVGPAEPILLVAHHPFHQPFAQPGDIVNSAEVLRAFDGHYLALTITAHFHENIEGRDDSGVLHFVVGGTSGHPADVYVGYRLFSIIGQDLWSTWVPKNVHGETPLVQICEIDGPGELDRDWEIGLPESRPLPSAGCLHIEYSGGPMEIFASGSRKEVLLCRVPRASGAARAFLPLTAGETACVYEGDDLRMRVRASGQTLLNRLRMYHTGVQWHHHVLRHPIPLSMRERPKDTSDEKKSTRGKRGE
ncbi:MAG: metallophosphoesterase [Planctomycetota bacterium]